VKWEPVGAIGLAGRLAEQCLARHRGVHPLRVALDGPRSSRLGLVADQLGDILTTQGRPVGVVDARTFYRDASLRFEYGKTDVESFYGGWLDRQSLEREVLRPSASPAAHYLPKLRDPDTNRSSRARPVTLPASGVLIVVGELLLGNGLSFDLSIHFAVSRLARRRQFDDETAWTLAAFDRYDIDVDPAGSADIVIRYDDRSHPAVRMR